MFAFPIQTQEKSRVHLPRYRQFKQVDYGTKARNKKLLYLQNSQMTLFSRTFVNKKLLINRQ